MWCDNCCLLFPLKYGAMTLAFFMMLWSLVGSIFLFVMGKYFWFGEYESGVYGTVSAIVFVMALISFIGLSKSSQFFLRLMVYCWPIVLVASAIRAIVMLYQLKRNESTISWECANHAWFNSTLFNTTQIDANTTVPPSMANSTAAAIPQAFCSLGSSTLFMAFALAVVGDIALQTYQWFLDWRYMRKLIHQYAALQTKLAQSPYV